MDNGERLVRLARRRAALAEWFKMLGTTMELSRAREKETHLRLTEGWYVFIV